MFDIASLHVKTVGLHEFCVMQNDFNGLSRVHHDGKVYLYDTEGVCIDDFRNFVLTAFYYDSLDDDDVSFMSYSEGFFWADVP